MVRFTRCPQTDCSRLSIASLVDVGIEETPVSCFVCEDILSVTGRSTPAPMLRRSLLPEEMT